ncbi:MAG TPA: branched-chain amino acid ABC transporter permease/ATP-binding protein [Acidimicrobiales bacterium]|nr:branched-chain amino acid ABC transporter permease/ATP-binding protein [Acidimicrobiales bacterium]
MLAAIAPTQVLADGLINGLVYGLVGMGVVLVYRSTRVINFAVGAMGLPGAALVMLLGVQYHFPYWLSVVVALLAGTAFALAAELIVIRRLFHAPRVILLVATIGLAQLALALTMALPDITELHAAYPTAWGRSLHLGSVELSGPDLMTLVTVPLVAGALSWLMARTRFGRSVAASADNPDLSRMSGINPKLVSSAVWAIAGLISTVSLILIAGRTGQVTQVATLGPATLTRGLIVAVLAGMASFSRSLLAGIAVGLVEAVVQFHAVTDPGRFESWLLLAVLVAVFWQARRQAADTGAVFSFAPRSKPIPMAIRDRWWVRYHGRILFMVALAIGVAAPLIATAPTRSYLYASILCFALVALSVSVITGWSGQLSLGQMAFAGVAALGTATLVRGATYHIGLPGGQVLKIQVPHLSMPVAVLIMTLVTAAVATLIGVGALRIRGLLLGVSTFVFAYAAQQDLFHFAVFTGGLQPPIRAPRGTLFSLDLTEQRTFYWVVLGVFAVVMSVVARLRRRGPGRALVAVRDNQATASGYTVNPTRTKLAGFAVSGAIAALGGALLGLLSQNINTNQLFVVGDSLDVVAIAVIGGLGSVAGPLLGALWVKGLPAFFPDNDLVPLFSSSIGLLLLLLYFPGGLVQIGYWARDAVFAWAAKRAPEVERVRAPAVPTRRSPRLAAGDASDAAGAPGAPGERGEGEAAEATAALAANEIKVHFGGVRAVDGASITVRRGEVVGLIGTNGAGKSTLLNAVGGYVRAEGEVWVHGTRVDGMAPHRRARLGLGRTFQAANLFPELTVRDTVMVALEARSRTSMLATAFAYPPAGAAERRKAAEAAELIDFLGLGRYADSFVSDLSTGTRRIVELAGVLALDPDVLCLDEPTAGVAQRETEAFGPLLLAIRRELGASLLIVEHDMPLIMSMSDRVYCLEAGRVIAEGPPARVREDPRVIASYLGTDARAIDRSDAARPQTAGTR